LGKLRFSKESVLETRLDVEDISLMADKHSDFAKGVRISADNVILYDNKVDRKKLVPKVKRPSGAINLYTQNLGAYILDFVSPSKPSRNQAKRKKPNQDRIEQTEMLKVLRQIDCPLPCWSLGTNNRVFYPVFSRLYGAKQNPKQHFESKKESVD
jgi:hypothetical protein